MIAYSVHHLLLVAFSRSNRAMLTRTRALGLLPGQPKVLEQLHDHEGCTQQDIARACAMDKSTVTSVVSRMVDAGLVERCSRKDDRRVSSLYLTDAGRSAADEVMAIGAKVDATAAHALTEEERAELVRLLSRVIENLSSDESEGRA